MPRSSREYIIFKMPKSKIILAIGVVIALLPMIGFPHAWEAFFQVLAGLGIIFLSVWTTIDKRISLRVKAQKRQIHKIRVSEIEAQKELEQVADTPMTLEE